MPPVPTTALIQHIISLVETVPEVQTVFDQAYNDELQRCVAALVETSGPQAISALAALLPSRLSVSEYQVTASLLCSSTKASSADLGLRLHGLPLHAFVALRYGTSVEQRDRLTLTVTAVPRLPTEHDR